MDAVSYSLASKQAQRIEKFIKNPDSNSGIVTVPKVIGAGENVTIPAGRMAVLPNVQVDGTLNIEGEVFIPSGATFSKVVETEGNQTIAGVKTFSSSPIVPTPTNGTQAVNKDYVDINSFNPTPTIASGTATFNSTTNNINLTGIGIGVEIGDVIQISGAEDAKNNSEFTIEVITDNDNIIVNQAHANKGTSKNVANRASDAGVTVKLLAKWFNAPIGLGQGWVSVTGARLTNVNYSSPFNMLVSVHGGLGSNISLFVDNVQTGDFRTYNISAILAGSVYAIAPKGSIFKLTEGSFVRWVELR